MRLDDQCLQLYRVAHNMWKDNDIKLAEKYYQRIRVEHGCELYYEVVLPKNMMLVHPVGNGSPQVIAIYSSLVTGVRIGQLGGRS